MNLPAGSAQIPGALVRRRKRQIAAFLHWAAVRENTGRSLRWSQRRDIGEAAAACALFEEPWWGLVVFTCFGRIEGARFVAGRFRRPRPDAARVLDSIEFPPGMLGHDRAQAGHRGAKLALATACLRAGEFQEILLRGQGFDQRYRDLLAMRARYWGPRSCFDLTLRAGAIGIGGERYGPQRAYLDKAPARGFLEVTGVPVTARNAEWCELFLRWWSDHWEEVASLAGVHWEGAGYEPGDFENALCGYQDDRRRGLLPS